MDPAPGRDGAPSAPIYKKHTKGRMTKKDRYDEVIVYECCKVCFCNGTCNKSKYCAYKEDEEEAWPKDESYVNIMLCGRLTTKASTNDGKYFRSKYSLHIENKMDASYGMIQAANGSSLGIAYNGLSLKRKGAKRKEWTDPGEGVAKTKRDLPAPTQEEPLTPLKHKWDFTGPWTTSATIEQQGETHQEDIIDFSLLNLDSPPPVEKVYKEN